MALLNCPGSAFPPICGDSERGPQIITLTEWKNHATMMGPPPDSEHSASQYALYGRFPFCEGFRQLRLAGGCSFNLPPQTCLPRTGPRGNFHLLTPASLRFHL